MKAKIRYIQDLIIATLFGMLIAWIIFNESNSFNTILGIHPNFLGLIDMLNTLATSIIIYIVLSRRKERRQEAELAAEKARTESMRLIGASIAHELRTPLHAVKLFAQGVKNYLPPLIETYNIAKQHKLDIPIIRPQHLTMLNDNIDSIDLQVDHSTLIIDMLLTNISFKTICQTEFNKYSISDCIDKTLESYPFSEKDKQLVSWDRSQHIDFIFLGSDHLIIQVLFNLIKNALYFINSKRRGIITIWLEHSKKCNKLHVKDTAQGIDPDTLPYIFEKFFTKDTAHGTGIGLAFCKMCMQAHDGDITCESDYGKYTQFTLTLPLVDSVAIQGNNTTEQYTASLKFAEL